jgi:hypothetical protein
MILWFMAQKGNQINHLCVHISPFFISARKLRPKLIY